MAERLDLGDLIYKLGFESEAEFLASLERVLNQADSRASQEGAKAGATYSKSFKETFSASLTGAAVGATIATVLTAAFSQALAATREFVSSATREFVRYEQGLVQLKLAGETNLAGAAEQIKNISEQSRVFSQTDISITLGEMVKAGYDTATAMELVAKSTNLASAEIDAATGQFLDLTSVTQSVSDILSGLDYDISQASRVINVLGKTAQDSKLSLSDLVPAISKIAGTARSVGLEVEDLGAAFAALKDRGISADIAATGLRSVLNSLIQPPATAREAFDKLGLTFLRADGTTRSFADVLGALNRVVAAGPRGLQLLALGMDTFALNTAVALGRSNTAIADFKAQLQNAEGATKQLGDTLKETAAGQMREFEAQINSAKVALGQELQPVIVTFYRDIAPDLVNALKNIISLYSEWRAAILNVVSAEYRRRGELEKSTKQYGDVLGAQIFDVEQRLRESEKRLNEAKRRLATVPFTSQFIAPNFLLMKQLRDEIAKLESSIPRLQREREMLLAQAEIERQARPAPASVEKKTPPPPQATTPIELPNIQKEKKPAERRNQEDPIVKQANALQLQIKTLQDTFELGRINAEKYSAGLAKLREQLVALEKSATTTTQKSAVLSGLTQIKNITDALNRDKLDKRLQQLNAELERQQELFNNTSDVSAYAGALADLQKKADALSKSADEKSRANIEQFLKRVADGQKKVAQFIEQQGIEAATAMSELAAMRLQAIYGDGVQATLSGIRRAAPDFKSALLALVEIGLSTDEAEKLAAAAFPSDFVEYVSEQWAQEFERSLQRTGERTGDILAIELQARIRQMSVDELLTTGRNTLLDWLDTLREFGLEATNEALRVQYALATLASTPAEILVAGAQNYTDALNRVATDISDFADYSSVGLADFRQLLDRIIETAGNTFAAIEELISLEAELRQTIAAGFSDSQEAARAAVQLEAVTGALDRLIAQLPRATEPLDRFNASLDGFERNISNTQDTVEVTIGSFTYFIETMAQLEELLSALDDDALFGLFDALEQDAEDGNEKAQLLLDTLRQIVIARSDAFGEPIPGMAEFRAAERAGFGQDQGKDAFERDEQQRRDTSRREIEQLESQIADVAMSFPRAIVQGILDGNIAGALSKALGSAADFFLNKMLESILGPIATQLGQAVAAAMAPTKATGAAAAFNPLGLAIGAGALLLSFLFRPQSAPQRAASEQQSVRSSATPTITYNIEAILNATLQGGLDDPAVRTELRSLARQVALDVLREVRLVK